MSNKKVIVCNTCKHFITSSNHYCGQCNHCRTECHCRRRAGINSFQIPRSKSAGIGNSSMFVRSKRAIGLELELSNFGEWTVRQDARGNIGKFINYKIVHDGSVRPSQLEAVIEPLAGDQKIIEGLNSIANHLYINECEVNETCGYHVHVDARDFSWYDIQKLLFLWLGIENHDTIWQLAGRLSNDFCKPWGRFWVNRNTVNLPVDIEEFKKTIIEKCYGFKVAEFADLIKATRKSRRYREHLMDCKYTKTSPLPAADFCEALTAFKGIKNNRGWNRAVPARYVNLNVHSWIYRGTIEYRLGAGTVDVDRVRMWPIFCLWLTEAASRTSLNIIRKHYYDHTSNINILYKIIDQGGILIPSINGNKIYKMPPYLKQWCTNVLHNQGKTIIPQADTTVKPEARPEVKPISYNRPFEEELQRIREQIYAHSRHAMENPVTHPYDPNPTFTTSNFTTTITNEEERF